MRKRPRNQPQRVTERFAALTVAGNLGFHCEPLLSSRKTVALSDDERAAFNAELSAIVLPVTGDAPSHAIAVTLPTALVMFAKLAASEPQANTGRERPSKQKTRGLLMQCVDAMSKHAPDGADVHKAMALLLMLNDLDTLSVFWPSDDALATCTGGMRVSKLAAKLRDITRDKSGQYVSRS